MTTINKLTSQQKAKIGDLHTSFVEKLSKQKPGQIIDGGDSPNMRELRKKLVNDEEAREQFEKSFEEKMRFPNQQGRTDGL